VRRIGTRSGVPFFKCPTPFCRFISKASPSPVYPCVSGDSGNLSPVPPRVWGDPNPAQIPDPFGVSLLSLPAPCIPVPVYLPSVGGVPALSVFAAFGVEGQDVVSFSPEGSPALGTRGVVGADNLYYSSVPGVAQEDPGLGAPVSIPFATSDSPDYGSFPSHAERTTDGEEFLTSVEAGPCVPAVPVFADFDVVGLNFPGSMRGDLVDSPGIVPSPSHAERTTEDKGPLTSVEDIPIVCLDIDSGSFPSVLSQEGIGPFGLVPGSVDPAPAVDIGTGPGFVLVGFDTINTLSNDTRSIACFSGNLALADPRFIAFCADIASFHPVPSPVTPPAELYGPRVLDGSFSFPSVVSFDSVAAFIGFPVCLFVFGLFLSTGSLFRRWIAFVCYFLRAPPPFLPFLRFPVGVGCVSF
jgi:hypothetical protein